MSLGIGPAILGDRLHPIVGRWVAAIEQACGIAEGRPLEIPMSAVALTPHNEVRADCAIGETAAATVEQRLQAWIRQIPGA